MTKYEEPERHKQGEQKIQEDNQQRIDKQKAQKKRVDRKREKVFIHSPCGGYGPTARICRRIFYHPTKAVEKRGAHLIQTWCASRENQVRISFYCQTGFIFSA